MKKIKDFIFEKCNYDLVRDWISWYLITVGVFLGFALKSHHPDWNYLIMMLIMDTITLLLKYYFRDDEKTDISEKEIKKDEKSN